MSNLRFIALFLILFPLSLLPLRWSQAIGARLGKRLIQWNKKRAHIALCNIQTAFPALTEEEQKKLVAKTAEESGKWLIESTYVWFRNPRYLQKKITVSNPELLKSAHAKGRGVVMILPHFGNWEFLNYYLPNRFPFGAMYKPVKSPVLEKLILRGRSRLGSQLFPTDSRGVRQALKALRKDTVIAILSDHLPSQQAGVYAPFFNQPALTGKFTQVLANSNHSPVLIATVLRKPKGLGFTISFREVNGMHTDDAIEAATALNQAIEKSILIAPEQYQWVYKRFAHPPQGAKDIYQSAE